MHTPCSVVINTLGWTKKAWFQVPAWWVKWLSLLMYSSYLSTRKLLWDVTWGIVALLSRCVVWFALPKDQSVGALSSFCRKKAGWVICRWPWWITWLTIKNIWVQVLGASNKTVKHLNLWSIHWAAVWCRIWVSGLWLAAILVCGVYNGLTPMRDWSLWGLSIFCWGITMGD